MADYKIVTDMTADLPEKYCIENDIEVLNFPFSVDDDQYTNVNQIDIKEFYKQMREGRVTHTSQLSRADVEECFRRHLDSGKDVVMFVFSSALSGTCASVQNIAEELNEEYKDNKVYVFDTLSASMGEGLFVMKAAEKKAEGLSAEELCKWAEEFRGSVIQIFTVDDLMFLHRGGRVSKTAAVAGSILGIKPILHVSDEGKLVPVKKIRGRKQALKEMVNMMAEQMGDVENPYFTISHGDCKEDAQFVVDEIKKRFGIKKSVMNFVGPVVGSHSGPGTVALFFIGVKR